MYIDESYFVIHILMFIFFIKEMEKQIKELTTEIETLKSKKQPFSVFQIINDEKKIFF